MPVNSRTNDAPTDVKYRDQLALFMPDIQAWVKNETGFDCMFVHSWQMFERPSSDGSPTLSPIASLSQPYVSFAVVRDVVSASLPYDYTVQSEGESIDLRAIAEQHELSIQFAAISYAPYGFYQVSEIANSIRSFFLFTQNKAKLAMDNIAVARLLSTVDANVPTESGIEYSRQVTVQVRVQRFAGLSDTTEDTIAQLELEGEIRKYNPPTEVEIPKELIPETP